ncbi:MAG TPA: fimbrial assembly protein [Acidobacteriaceae bacterium]
MKITLNLATRPYIELRPIYTRLRLMMLVLAALALPMLLVLRVEQAKARIATSRVEQLRSRIAHLEGQQRAARALMQRPENAMVLSQADFLNELFRRKAFSWTATMSDLEVTLPSGVQVLSIDPIVAADGHVTIRLRVSGPRERAVEVVRNLERSRHFVAPRLASEALASPNGGGPTVQQVSETGGSPTDVSFEILADYRPLPNSHDLSGVAAEPVAEAAPLPAGAPVVESVPVAAPAHRSMDQILGPRSTQNRQNLPPGVR